MNILINNWADTATTTASPAMVTGLTEQNLKVLERSLTARTTSTVTQTINLTWSNLQLFSGFALCRLAGFSNNATLELWLYDDINQTGNVVFNQQINMITIVGWGNFNWGETWGQSIFAGQEDRTFCSMWFNAVLAKSAKITFSDSTPLGSYFDLGRLYLGSSITPQSNISVGMSHGLIDDTELVRMDSGILKSFQNQEPYISLGFSLPMLDDSERAIFFRWLKSGGKRKDVFVSVFPEEEGAKFVDFSLQAKITENPQFVALTGELWENNQYKIEET